MFISFPQEHRHRNTARDRLGWDGIRTRSMTVNLPKVLPVSSLKSITAEIPGHM
jgi:hypothetical protein